MSLGPGPAPLPGSRAVAVEVDLAISETFLLPNTLQLLSQGAAAVPASRAEPTLFGLRPATAVVVGYLEVLEVVGAHFLRRFDVAARPNAEEVAADRVDGGSLEIEAGAVVAEDVCGCLRPSTDDVPPSVSGPSRTPVEVGAGSGVEVHPDPGVLEAEVKCFVDDVDAGLPSRRRDAFDFDVVCIDDQPVVGRRRPFDPTQGPRVPTIGSQRWPGLFPSGRFSPGR